ncbi:MAG: hypothetical protein HXK75_01650 [Granulicatella sp.]|nr:hypothetical protein [Granulicatella sp.]
MYDDNKVKLVRKAITATIGFICLIVGIACGMWIGSSNSPRQQMISTVEEARNTDESKTLTAKKIKEFLLAYYTKKDVGENQERYKEFMTEQLYAQQVKLDESPVTQAYKGYILNQVYDKATIYIDEENLSALVEVAYSNIQTTKRNNAEAGVKLSEKATIKLFYTKDKEKYLVNRIEPILLKNATNNENHTSTKTPEAKPEKTEQTTKVETTQQPPTTTTETTEVGTVKIRGTL